MTNPLKHYTQWAKPASVPLEIGYKTGMSSSTTLIQHGTGSPSHSNQIRRRNNMHPAWKGRSKTAFVCR